MSECIFCRIAAGQLETDILFQDDRVCVFRDIVPKAPIHLLIIPNAHIASIDQVEPGHAEILSHMLLTAQKMSRDCQVDQSGYRLVFNTHDEGGQTVPHLHLHLLAGRQMTWPPG